MNDKITVCLGKGGQREMAESFARKNNVPIMDKPGEHLKAIDATAGMGEDGFLLAAYGYEVTLYEQNPVIAALLKDALRRARKHPVLKDIASRMKLVEGDSVCPSPWNTEGPE